MNDSIRWIIALFLPVATGTVSWFASRALLTRKMRSEKVVIGVIGQPKPEGLIPYHTYTRLSATKKSRFAISVLICRSLSYAYRHCDFVQLDTNDLDEDPKLIGPNDLASIGSTEVAYVGAMPLALSHFKTKHYSTLWRALRKAKYVWAPCVMRDPRTLADKLSLRGVLTTGPEEKLYDSDR